MRRCSSVGRGRTRASAAPAGSATLSSTAAMASRASLSVIRPPPCRTRDLGGPTGLALPARNAPQRNDDLVEPDGGVPLADDLASSYPRNPARAKARAPSTLPAHREAFRDAPGARPPHRRSACRGGARMAPAVVVGENPVAASPDA